MTDTPAGKTSLRAQRKVLAVTRNRASVFRMLEVVKLFDNDDRVTIRTTIGPDSRYEHGVDQLLLSEQIRPLPWSTAVASTFDLAISATTHASLHQLNAPIVVFPHGAGHHKRHPAVSGGEAVFELMPQQLLHNGSIIPNAILLPGNDSLRRLHANCPDATPHAIVAGDPIAQQIQAHRTLRDSYRADLGLRPGQRLLVVASSWGPGSLAARSLDLIRRLVAELPMDQYRVAAAFHHNVTIHDGPYDLQRRLSSAIDSGLILLPPRANWQTAVIAAHGVIGDGGSMSFYSAAVAPLAIASHDPAEYPDDGPIASLIDTVPRFDPEAPLLPQVERLLDSRRPPELTAILNSSIDRKVDAAAVFRSTMYGLMNLSEPPADAFLPLHKPEVTARPVTAFSVAATIHDDGARVELLRYPAASAATGTGRHLVARTDDDDPRARTTAAALVAVYPADELPELLRDNPGCRLATQALSPRECRLLDRDGNEYAVTVVEPITVDVAELAASVYYGLSWELPEPPEAVTVDCGGETTRLTFRRVGG